MRRWGALLLFGALALVCGVLAVGWAQAREENLCWRAYVLDGEQPPEGDCLR